MNLQVPWAVRCFQRLLFVLKLGPFDGQLGKAEKGGYLLWALKRRGPLSLLVQSPKSVVALQKPHAHASSFLQTCATHRGSERRATVICFDGKPSGSKYRIWLLGAFFGGVLWIWCLLFPRAVFPPTAESFGVSAQIGSGVVRGGPEVRFHEGSTRVPPGFHRVPPQFHKVLRGLQSGASTKKSTAWCWGYHLSLFVTRVGLVGWLAGWLVGWLVGWLACRIPSISLNWPGG